jgi:hypothetical protein
MHSLFCFGCLIHELSVKSFIPDCGRISLMIQSTRGGSFSSCFGLGNATMSDGEAFAQTMHTPSVGRVVCDDTIVFGLRMKKWGSIGEEIEVGERERRGERT